VFTAGKRRLRSARREFFNASREEIYGYCIRLFSL